MRYLLFVIVIMTLSCEPSEGVLIKDSRSATASVTYQINSAHPVDDIKMFEVRELILFLANKSGAPFDEINRITLQGISIRLSLNPDNTAQVLSFETQVSEQTCEGLDLTLTPFSLIKTLPLNEFAFNLLVPESVDISNEGVAALNNIILGELPFGPYNGMGENSCNGINFVLDGSVTPANSRASLRLDVVIRYNIEYSICEDDPFIEVLSSGKDKCNF